MASLRKATAYSKKKVVPYTRVSKKAKNSFIKAVPPQKIVKFTMGKEPLYRRGKLIHCLTVVTAEKIQVRHNALEACRQYINKKLDKELAGQYYFKILPYTHHVQRENRMLTGAGADRMQTGMQLAFGKSMGKSAIMKKNGRLFFIAVPNEKALSFTRGVLKQIRSKLPCKIKVLYEKFLESNITLK
ncbi:50S ribosomal protein L16 [Candidatus Pacearchaeota archaeon]|nr:50S ribosomal protein L16 [Candidatus Pacearchaeota archaeon]